MTVRLKRFKVQAPDGSYLTIEGPEDATDDELIAAAEANWQPAPEPAKMEPAPQVKGPAQPTGRGGAGGMSRGQLAAQEAAARQSAQSAKDSERAASAARGEAPYADLTSALDDAVNYIEEGQPIDAVAKSFGKAGITQEQIIAHGKARGSQAFAAPAERTAVSGKFSPAPLAGEMRSNEPDSTDAIVNFGKRTKQNIGMISDVLAMESGLLSKEATAGSVARRNKALSAARPSEQTVLEQEAIMQAGKEGWGELFVALKDNPTGFFTMLADSVAQSTPAIGAAVVGSLAGPGGTAAGAGAASLAMEYSSTIMNSLQEAGMNPANGADVLRFFNDPELMAKARESGAKRGIVIGAFDALSAGVAGKFIRPVIEAAEAGSIAGRQLVKAASVATAKEAGVQMGAGASGEALGQLADKGKIEDRASIALEAFAELPGGFAEAGLNLRSTRAASPGSVFANAFEQDTAERNFNPQAIQEYAASSLSPDFNDPSRIDPRIQAQQLARERAMEAARQAPKVEQQQSTPLTPEQIAQMGSSVATPPLQPANEEKPQQQVPQVNAPNAMSDEEMDALAKEWADALDERDNPVSLEEPVARLSPDRGSASPQSNSTAPVEPAPQSGPAAANSIGVASVQQGSLADRALAAVQPTQPAQPAQAPVTQEQPKAEPVPPAKTYATKDEALIEGARIGVTPTQTATGWTLTQPASKATEPTLADIESAPTPQELAQDAADVEALNGAYRRMNDEAVRQSTNPKEAQDIRSSLVSVVPVPTTDPVARAVRAVAGSAFGIRVVTVKGMRDSGVAWDGTKKTVYINEGLSTSETIVSTVGHEALHSLKSTRPDLYNRYQEQLLPLLRAGVVAKRQKFESGAKAKDEGLISPERATEEVLADVSGSMWLQPEFWGRVAEIDKDLFRTLRYRFMQGMTKMLKAVNAYKGQRMQIETLVKDVAAAREHTAQLWAAKAMGAKPSKAEQKIDAELDAALAGFEGEGGRVLSSRQAYEVAPDPDQKAAKAKWDSQSFGQKVERTAKLDSTYFPRIAKTIGVDPRLFSAQQTFGGYLGDVNPSVVRTNLKGDDETTVKVARALANVYDQQSVMAVLKSPSKDSMLSDAVEVELNADLTADQARAIYDAVRSAPGGKWIEGFTAVGKKMQFVNVGGPISDTQKVDFQKALEAADLPLEWKSSVVRGLNIEFIGRSGNEGDMAAGQAGIGDERAAGTGGDSSLAGLKQEFAQERLNFSRSDDAGGVGAGGRQVLAGQDGASEQAARQEQKALSDLPGYPTTPAHQGPDKRLVGVAKLYAKSAGIKLQRQPRYFKADPARGKRIADAYEAMPHAPQDPKVQEAYRNLIEQTTAQYRALEKAGYKFWLYAGDSDPYATNPWNAMRDLRANQSMGVFSTRAGFGSDAAFDPQDNPLLAATGIELPFGSPNGTKQEVLANDLFRAVHDAFGHGLEGVGFRADGEENAWQAHARLFTGSALGALTSETRGQNSWLNFGPKGDANRTAGLFDTTFADQKTGLMPEWTWREGLDGPKASRDDSVDWDKVEYISDDDYKLDEQDLNDELREEQEGPRLSGNGQLFEAKPSAIKAKGIFMEDAFPEIRYGLGEGTLEAEVSVAGDSYVFKLMEYDPEAGLWAAIPDNSNYESIGSALRLSYVTEGFARGYNQRVAASFSLGADGYDLAKQVDAKQAKRLLATWRSVADIPGAFEFVAKPDIGLPEKPGKFNGAAFVARAQAIVDELLANSPRSFKVQGRSYYGAQTLMLIHPDAKEDTNGVPDSAYMELNEEDGRKKIILHAVALDKGSGWGKAFYQAAALIAKEYGVEIVADPDGLTGVNTYRRTEQMMSAALRSGDANVIRPGDGQRVYGWERGKTKAARDGNLLRLLLASARNAKEVVPMADQLRYDLATDAFTLDGQDASDMVKKALSKPDARATSVSRSTLARAAITFEAMQGEVELPSNLNAPVLYSRAEETTPLDSISTDDYKVASGRELVLEGDDGSSLRIDAAVLFKDFQSRRELAKTVLDCLA